MKIAIITPAPAGSHAGNRVTALRWRRLLRQLGHRVTIRQEYAGEGVDLLVALHARRSFDAIARFRRAYPDRPLIVTLTGTDLYKDIRTSQAARQALEWATRLIVLQPLAVAELPQHLRSKTRVIYQSVERLRAAAAPRDGVFEVCVLGHLRPVKDPMRTALASRLLPESSRVRVLHLGAALSAATAKRARREVVVNPRYRWLGDVPRWKAQRLLARCRLLVQSSRLEGGANAIGEAIAASVPVLSSHIPGSIGLLGADYPGYFPTGDTRALAELLYRAENDSAFYKALQAHCRRRHALFVPLRERTSWHELLRECLGSPSQFNSPPPARAPRAAARRSGSCPSEKRA